MFDDICSASADSLTAYYGAEPIICMGDHLHVMSECATGRDLQFVSHLRALLRPSTNTNDLNVSSLTGESAKDPEERIGQITAGVQQEQLIAMLPGMDGSTIHCRALIAWLTNLDGVQPLEVQIDSYPGLPTTDAVATWCVKLISDRLQAKFGLTILGYSAGGALLPFVSAAAIQRGLAVKAHVILEAPSLQMLEHLRNEHPAHAVAASVLDVVPLDLDGDALEMALIDEFPTYAKRFHGTRLFAKILVSVAGVESPTCGDSIRELLLLSADARKSSSYSAVLEERPQAEVARFDCGHLQLPYHAPAAERIAKFLCAAASADQMRQGLVAFERVNAVGERARSDFRKRWRTTYGSFEFRLGSPLVALQPPAAIQVDVTTELGEIGKMQAALQANGLHQYDALACRKTFHMQGAEAEAYLLERVGMKRGHAHRFIKSIWSHEV